MRRNLRIMRLGHAGNFLGLQYAANPPQRHLQNRGRAGLQQAGKFIFGGQAFARRNGNGGLACHFGHFFRHFGRHGFLKP